MYLAMAVTGILLVTIGLIMSQRKHANKDSETNREEEEAANILRDNEPKLEQIQGDYFSIELFKQQIELINKRIDSIENRLSELEGRVDETTNSNNNNAGECALDADSEKTSDEITNDNPSDNSDAESQACHNDINSIIYNMYDNGASLDDISSALRIGRGELQLRLGLRKPRNKQQGF